MLFLQLGCNFNHLAVILDKPIFSFQFRPHDVQNGQHGVLTGKKKLVYLKLWTNHWSYSLAVKTTYFTLYLSNLNPEDEVCSFKIDRFMVDYFSKLKWAWQAQFLGYTLLLLQINVTFYDIQMILQ